MRLLGAALAVAAAAVGIAPVVTELPAAASCAEPTVKFSSLRINRGAVLTITGRNFGDDCLDTGTVPAGVGPLGSPLTGLAIVIDQGEREFLVATGSADSDYEFEVDVVVPSELEPGEATLSIMGAIIFISPPNMAFMGSDASSGVAGGACGLPAPFGSISAIAGARGASSSATSRS